MWWKKNKWKVLVPVLIAAVLAVAFFAGGIPGRETAAPENAVREELPDEPPATPPEETRGELPPEDVPAPAPPEVQPSEEMEPPMEEPPAGETTVEEPPEEPPAETVPAPEAPPGEPPAPPEPEEPELEETELTCTLSIRCDTILNNPDLLDPEKAELVPGDGVILSATQVIFYEGESVFDVLQRTCREQGIHLEFVNVPLYNSAYIEGIHNLYEFDCGDISGWMYRVNGWFPNYGCSRYVLQDGDVVEWLYTCDLGDDIGGRNQLD